MKAISNRMIGGELVARGLVPPDSRLLEIIIAADGAMVVRLEQHVTGERLAAFAAAFAAVASRVNDDPAAKLTAP